MKTIYFLSNNLLCKSNIFYPNIVSSDEIEALKPLSVKGEKNAYDLINLDFIKDLNIIYSSKYLSAINACKYISENNKIDIILSENLNERKIGNLYSNEYTYLKGMQEHDFNYKLEFGESINESKVRITNFIKEILKSDYENILVVSHNVILKSLFLNWCQYSYSLDDDLILEYIDNVIFDGTINDIDLIKVDFDELRILNIERLK